MSITHTELHEEKADVTSKDSVNLQPLCSLLCSAASQGRWLRIAARAREEDMSIPMAALLTRRLELCCQIEAQKGHLHSNSSRECIALICLRRNLLSRLQTLRILASMNCGASRFEQLHGPGTFDDDVQPHGEPTFHWPGGVHNDDASTEDVQQCS